MDKKGQTLIIKTIMGLVIAVVVIVFLLLPLLGKFNLFAKEKQDSQINYFNELNKKIKAVGINQQETQIFELKDNYLLVAFNNEDTEINLKDIKIYSGNKRDVTEKLKKTPSCEICLCLCNTEDDKILFENDCLQPEDICIEQEKNIINGTKPFFLFEPGIKNLKIKGASDKIDIKYE